MGPMGKGGRCKDETVEGGRGDKKVASEGKRRGQKGEGRTLEMRWGREERRGGGRGEGGKESGKGGNGEGRKGEQRSVEREGSVTKE